MKYSVQRTTMQYATAYRLLISIGMGSTGRMDNICNTKCVNFVSLFEYNLLYEVGSSRVHVSEVVLNIVARHCTCVQQLAGGSRTYVNTIYMHAIFGTSAKLGPPAHPVKT